MSENRSFRNMILPWLSPAGAVIAFICFFLPWVEVRAVVKKIMGSGFTFAQDEMLLWMVPVFALIIFALFVMLRKKESLLGLKVAVIIFAGLGMFMMIMTYLSIEQKLSGFFVKQITSYEIKIGLPGTIIGFLISFISAVFIKSTRIGKSETDDMVKDIS